MTSYTPITSTTFQIAVDNAKAAYLKVLGGRPSYKSVATELPDVNPVNAWEWGGIVLFLVLMVAQWFKLGALAQPFAAESLDALGKHTFISTLVGQAFQIVTTLNFMGMGTLGIIYFKILSADPAIVEGIEKSKITRWSKEWVKVFSLGWISPRLPTVIVYLIVGWLVYIGFQTPGDAFTRFLPTILEVGLAYLVSSVIEKRQQYRQRVLQQLDLLRKAYDARVANFERDRDYLRLLYKQLWIAILNHRVNGRQPNATLLQLSENERMAVIMQEYRRWTAGDQFAEAIIQPAPAVAAVTESVGRRGLEVLKKYGRTTWDSKSLLRDLQVTNAPKPMSRKLIRERYAPGLGADEAWSEIKDKYNAG
jgi:hypothetical protein